jgi:hypothetical protein
LHSYETISDLMNLQDQIDSFQRMIFAHFKYSNNNECRISALVPLVKESWGIYRFITSMLRAMHRSRFRFTSSLITSDLVLVETNDPEALLPLVQRYNSQHHALRKFYYECSNLKYLTGLINVPKLGQDPPNLTDKGDAPDLPARPLTTKPEERADTPKGNPEQAMIDEQARMLKEYEDKQAALVAAREAEEARRLAQERAQQDEFERRQREQAERERLAQEQLMQQQMMQYNNAAAEQMHALEREILAMRGQYERDQLMLEQYDRVRAMCAHVTKRC